MKRLSIVLALVLCASLLFCTPVSAAGEEARLYVKASGTAITVKVKTSAAVGALQGAVKYDETAFQYDSAVAAETIAPNNAAASSFSNLAGATKVALVGDPSTGTSGEWATLTYSADEGTPAVFDFAGVKAFSASGDKFTPTVKVIMPGDVDNDKLVTIKDYIRLKRNYCAGVAISGQAENKDVNMDGTNVASSDIPQLRKDLLGF